MSNESSTKSRKAHATAVDGREEKMHEISHSKLEMLFRKAVGLSIGSSGSDEVTILSQRFGDMSMRLERIAKDRDMDQRIKSEAAEDAKEETRLLFDFFDFVNTGEIEP